MKQTYPLLLLLMAILISSCAPSRYVEPLEKDTFSVGGSFGGPVINFGGPIPMPITSVDVGYGLDSNLTLFGGLHTTSAIFGNGQIDLGCTYQFLKQKGAIPNVSVSPSVNMIYDFGDQVGNIWPILDLNAFWNYGERKNYFYVGMNNYFELSRTGAHEQPQDYYWLFSPQIGHALKGKKGHGQLITEMKYFAPYIDNFGDFVPYLPPGNTGALGFYISYRWTFGKKK